MATAAGVGGQWRTTPRGRGIFVPLSDQYQLNPTIGSWLGQDRIGLCRRREAKLGGQDISAAGAAYPDPQMMRCWSPFCDWH